MLAAIPSPSSGSIEIGSLELRAYGLMIALGVLAAIWLSQRRWVARGGTKEQITQIAVWAVPAGVIGARAYHVLTDWRRFHYDDGWGEAFAIWKGGLGIPGGMTVGILVGLWVAHRQSRKASALDDAIDTPAPLTARDAADAIAPALPLAQAIGRLGNWFNQELFGHPTDLPWALEIDASHRPVDYLNNPTFHPTFLYEGIWNIALCIMLIMIDRTQKLRSGALLAVYALGYGIGRLWIEALRSDQASLLAGVRINIWMSLLLILTSTLYLFYTHRPQSVT